MSKFKVQNTNSRSRGSALIIAMLVVVAISTAAFGISRIFLADVRISTSLEDSLKAYYLAEAGVEEGLLRYRVDRNDQGLNQTSVLTRPLSGGDYRMSTTFLTVGPPHVVNTVTERDPGGNLDFEPAGRVPKDETVEIYAPSTAGDVRVTWDWGPGGPPPFPDLGVEITSVPSVGTVENRVLITGAANTFTVSPAARTLIRAKPLGGLLASMQFSAANGPIGRTIQTVDSTGNIGRAKRRLQATINRRSGSIVGFFDYVLGSEGDIIRP